MFTFFTIIYWLTAHYICDFLLQRNDDTTNKNHSINSLINHTIMYSITMGFFYFISSSNNYDYLIFTITMFLTHTFIDFITSKIETYLYRKNNIKGFFNIVGIDQLLHYITIFLTIKYL